MKQRITAALLTLATLGLLLVPTTPANAYIDGPRCKQHTRLVGDDGRVCIRVNYRPQGDGTGIVVETIRLTASPDGAFENSPMVEGTILNISNDFGDIVWSAPLNSYDIGSSGERVIDLELKIQRPEGVRYHYKARLNNSPDKDGVIAWGAFGTFGA